MRKSPPNLWWHRLGPSASVLLQKLHRAWTAKRQAGGSPTVMTGSDPRHYFDPDILARVGFSPLLARLVVEGFISGLHKSPFHGFSVEFVDYREYVPGDDLKNIDWPLFARTDHYYIKRFEDETNLRCTILLDNSASMAFGTGALTKWDYSCFLASCLAYLMLKQQDAVGLSLFGDTAGALVRPRAQRTHLQQLMKVMMDHAPTGGTNIAGSLESVIHKLKRRGQVVVISDLIDDPEETLKALRLLASNRHDVIVFQIQDPAELEFSFQGATLFRDMETDEELEIDPAAVRTAYLARMQEVSEFYRTGLAEVEIDHHLINTRQPYHEALSIYLDGRSKVHRR